MKKLTILFCLVLIITVLSCKKDKPLPPILTTTAPTGVGATIATSGGNILSEGSSTILRRGVCYGIINTPTITNDTTFNGVGAGKFDSHLKNLNYNATYFVRAYAINAEGVGYGDVMSFKTPMAKVPTILTTNMATNITATSAYCFASGIDTEIGVPILAKGVCWCVRSQLGEVPTVSGNKAIGVDYTDYTTAFYATMTGLTENTLYAYTPYATNVVGTGYGDILVLMTPQLNPTTVHTGKPYGNGYGQYQANVTIPTVNNIQDIFGYGANWSTTPHPVASDAQYSVLGSPAIFRNYYTFNLTGLASRTLYYVRAWVNYNTATGHNLVYSNEEWFITM
jgi:hypothetical protein